MVVVILILILFFGSYFLHQFFKNKNGDFSADLTNAQKKLLADNVLYYNELSVEEQQRFTKRVAQFLNRIQIKTISCKLTEVDKILIGASAIIPVFGFQDWKYSNLRVVYLLPDAFNYKFEYRGHRNNRNILGMVGNGSLKYKMMLSQKALRHGFANKTDKHNTAIHEFIHLIDMADGDTDGLPMSLIEKPYALPWLNLIHKKIETIDDGESDINPYGATSKIEFFAVASEYFFERPKLLKRKHPKLYKKLSIFFNQDLA